MEDKYEITVTVGVRQLGGLPGGFQASDTYSISLSRFDDLFYVFGEIRNLADTLAARSTSPQGRGR